MINRDQLEKLYALYHRRELVHPDPLEFLYNYPDLGDREVVALVASSLAYGRVAQILISVSAVLERMAPSPSDFLSNASLNSLLSTFSDFKHRFTTGQELALMLWNAKGLIEQYGSLYAFFTTFSQDSDDTVLPALAGFVEAFNPSSSTNGKFSLLPSPHQGSACKRLNLFLRWMVRRDEVDPGGWDSVPASKLIVPLDIHMHRICLFLKLTRRKQADLRTAVDITRAFKRIAPEDPVRYDFVITRLGIRKDTDLAGFLEACSMK
jgi:uncharacterized protein (TIGR02757 family)